MSFRRLLTICIFVGICGLHTRVLYSADQSPTEQPTFTETSLPVTPTLENTQEQTPTNIPTGSNDEQKQMVIITLRQSDLPDAAVTPRDITQRQMQIRAMQDDFMRGRTEDSDVVWRMQTAPILVMPVTAQELLQVQLDPRVASVRVSSVLALARDEHLGQIGARALLPAGVTGAGTSVVVLDTGVLRSHTSLRGKVIQEACFSTTNPTYGSTSLCAGGQSQRIGPGSAPPCPLSIGACHHGTHVAGIVAGRPVVHQGVVTRGIAPDANIIAVQVFSRFRGTHTTAMCGTGATNDCVLAYEHDLIRALDWVASAYDPALWGTLAAVNMSLGNGNYAEPCDTDGGVSGNPFKWYIDQLRSMGVATVIAAGNGASKNGVAFPACVSSAISVGSVSSPRPSIELQDRPSPFTNVPMAASNVPNRLGDRLLDLYAPGESILSSIASADGASFAEYSGTSMAAPLVAGAWALMKSVQARASVSQVLQTLTTTGAPIVERREGYDTALVVPRINVHDALVLMRGRTPVQVNTWAIDFGDVQAGKSQRRRLMLSYKQTPASISWSFNDANYAVKPVNCDGFVDDLTPTCGFDIFFAPRNVTNDVVHATLQLVVNNAVYSVGLSGRSVAQFPVVAITQTAQGQATVHSLLTQTPTATMWPSPTSHVRARTPIAIATRTQRRRDGVAQTATQVVNAHNLTATHVVANGGPSVTPSPQPSASRTRTPLAITRTLVRAKQTTRQAEIRASATRAAVSTQTSIAFQRATLRALAVAQTATYVKTAGLPTFTATARPRRTQTGTITATATQTASLMPTFTPTLVPIYTQNIALPKKYRALVRHPLSDSTVMLYGGDASKSLLPELVVVNAQNQRTEMSLTLPGVDATVVSPMVNVRNRFVVAGRLNWDSMYIQTYDVTQSTGQLVQTILLPLSDGALVTAIYATDTRVFVGLSVFVAPSVLPEGRLLVIDTSSSSVNASHVQTYTLSGVPNALTALDDADALVIVGGVIPHARLTKGFVQTVQITAQTYRVNPMSERPLPVLDVAELSILQGLLRLHLVFVAEGDGLAVLSVDEMSGAVTQHQPVVLVPAAKLDRQADHLAVIGFDRRQRLNRTHLFQWSRNALHLRRAISHVNRDGGIVGVALHGANPVFADTTWLRFTR